MEIKQVRPATQANRFYTGNAQELENEVDSLLMRHSSSQVYDNLAALIVPHAGYYFSGNVAASAYMIIDTKKQYKRIRSIDEFQLHRHGIYIKKGYRSGTFLPQVADEVNWTKEEFLGHCAQDKAGIGWNGWRDAELYVYEAIVF